jgi:uncharacterized membrane protein HdeD (DUF308 family)
VVKAGNKKYQTETTGFAEGGGGGLSVTGRKRKKSWLPFIGIMLVLAGLVFFAATSGMVAAKYVLGLWPLFAIIAGVAGVMGFAVERKPRSPVSPMLLLFIGVLFFAGRFHSNLNALQLYGRYWILLLFVFAAVELIRYYSHRPTEGAPPRIFSFGKILMVLLIAGSGVVVNRVAVHNPSALASVPLPGFLRVMLDSVLGESHHFTDEAVALPAIKPFATLTINNSYGDVTVTGGATKAQAYLVKDIRSWDKDDASAINEKITLQVIPTADGGFTISTNRDQVNQETNHEYRTHIKIEVPSTLGLSITSSYGKVTANKIQGDVSIKSSYGGVEANDLAGNALFNLNYSDVKGSMIAGNVTVNGARNVTLSGVTGAATVNAKNGNVDLQQVKGVVKVDAPYSQITLQNLAESATVNTSHKNLKVTNAADVTIVAPHADVTATNLKGDLKIESSNSAILTSSISGDVTIQATHSNVTADDISGAIVVNTTHGDVTIKNFRQRVQVETNYNDVVLYASGPITSEIIVDNDKGEIKATFPQASNFRLDAESERGRVKLRGFDTTSRSDEGSLYTNVGSNGPLVKLRTSLRDIIVQASGQRQAKANDPVKAPPVANKN